MGVFGSIRDKIFHHPSAQAGDALAISAATSNTATAPAPAQVKAATTVNQTPATVVDVGAILATMASEKGDGGNYRTSIVDLLKLLDLDSSLDACKRLAQELDVHDGADGSSDENIALYKAVVQKLGQDGGKRPPWWEPQARPAGGSRLVRWRMHGFIGEDG